MDISKTTLGSAKNGKGKTQTLEKSNPPPIINVLLLFLTLQVGSGEATNNTSSALDAGVLQVKNQSHQKVLIVNFEGVITPEVKKLWRAF